jgi:hypothetical protein
VLRVTPSNLDYQRFTLGNSSDVINTRGMQTVNRRQSRRSKRIRNFWPMMLKDKVR